MRRKPVSVVHFPARRDTAEELMTTAPHFELDELHRSAGGSIESATHNLAELAADGHKAFVRGDFRSAKKAFETLATLGVRESFPYTMLGLVYLVLHREDAALAQFARALRREPTDVAALLYKGQLLMKRGEVRRARRALEKVIQAVGPRDPFRRRAQSLLDAID